MVITSITIQGYSVVYLFSKGKCEMKFKVGENVCRQSVSLVLGSTPPSRNSSRSVAARASARRSPCSWSSSRRRCRRRSRQVTGCTATRTLPSATVLPTHLVQPILLLRFRNQSNIKLNIILRKTLARFTCKNLRFSATSPLHHCFFANHLPHKPHCHNISLPIVTLPLKHFSI